MVEIGYAKYSAPDAAQLQGASVTATHGSKKTASRCIEQVLDADRRERDMEWSGRRGHHARQSRSPLVSIRDQLIKDIYICHILHTLCCSHARALRLGGFERIVLHVSDSNQHFNDCTVEWAYCRELRSTGNRSTNQTISWNADITGVQTRSTGRANGQQSCPRRGSVQP